MAKETVKCADCGEQVAKVEVCIYKKQNYHYNCYLNVLDKEKLWSYVCQKFGLISPGPANFKLANIYLQQGISYREMYFVLRYFYEIRHNSIDKANNRIGIIPYVLDEARTYYLNLEKEKNELSNQLKTQPNTIGRQVTSSEPTINKKKEHISLDSVGGDDDAEN
jgi:hypothetical protein